MNTSLFSPRTWIQCSAAAATPEILRAFISEMQREVNVKLLPAYRAACRHIAADYAHRSVPREFRGRRLTLTPLQMTEHMQARQTRARLSQELQVTVPALKLALVMWQNPSNLRGYRQDLPKLLLSFALRTPRELFNDRSGGLRAAAQRFQDLTQVQATKARDIIERFPALFPGSEQAVVLSAACSEESVDKDALYRKVMLSSQFSSEETKLLDVLFGRR